MKIYLHINTVHVERSETSLFRALEFIYWIHRIGHSERVEESHNRRKEIFHCVQDDKPKV